jgi:AraC-like DNA-binding protein
MTRTKRKLAGRVARKPDGLHTLFAPSIANLFQTLDVGLTLWRETRWREIYERPYEYDMTGFELEHAVESERVRYNLKCLAEARATGRTVVATHSGFTDLFVPVVTRGRAEAVLVTGPFALARPTASEILERWRRLTGRQGEALDPEFSHFIAGTLQALVLDGQKSAQFKLALELVARLLSGSGDAEGLIREIETLKGKLQEARLADRTWTIAQALTDARTSRSWGSPQRAPRLWAVGAKRIPEHVMVGLMVDLKRSDPVDERVRRDAFQRACVELARKAGNLSGRIGEHGFTLLAPGRGSDARSQNYLRALGDEAANLAVRRFELRVHLGLGVRGSLTEQYRTALAGAELALSKGSRVESVPLHPLRGSPLGQLSRELGRQASEGAGTLSASFERFLEGVGLRSGQRLDVARAYLELGVERIFDVVRETAALDPKSLATLQTELERSAAESGNMNELSASYRRAVADMSEALGRPRRARRDHGLRRALEYMQQHCGERLGLARVARVAGFAPNYFSELFRKQQGVTFERFLTQLRVARARQLLSSTALSETDLSLERIAQLSGFATRQYLGRVFKQETGETPAEFRKRVKSEISATARVTLPN